MADNSSHKDDEYSEISEFLCLSDLLLFKAKFIAAGVTKNEHFQDVDEHDLKDLKEFGKIC